MNYMNILSDLLLFLIAAYEPFDDEDQMALTILQKRTSPVILVINKIDLDRLKAEKLQRTIFDPKTFCAIHLISALTGIGGSDLLQKIITLLPEGPQYYPEDTLTDRNERFYIAELVREKVYKLTQQEIPYSVAIITDEVKERTAALTYVKATIYVERESQKKILIGVNGKKLKEIGQAARKEVEQLLQKKVYLDLWIKVKKNWRKDPVALKQLGMK